MGLLDKLFGKKEDANNADTQSEAPKKPLPEPSTLMIGEGEKKYFCGYDSGVSITDMADYILGDPYLPNLKSIVIGMWDEEIYDVDPNEILNMIVYNKEKFQHIEALFVGDMDSEENEISWIRQGNYEELLNALPALRSLTIKGSENLVLGKIDHPGLEALEIICGGLPVSVVNDIKAASLPNLRRLVLYSGDSNYGYDCDVADFADLAKKDLFPYLRHLGFTNSPVQDDLVRVILESDLLPQLKTIDISCGCLTDKGGQLILDAAGRLGNLEKLNASYHYMSEGMIEKLKALPFDVDISNAQEPYGQDGDMWPMITE